MLHYFNRIFIFKHVKFNMHYLIMWNHHIQVGSEFVNVLESIIIKLNFNFIIELAQYLVP